MTITHCEKKFLVGQYVWLLRQEQITDGTKVAPTFQDPYKTTKQKTPTTFEIHRVHLDIENYPVADVKVAHVSQLKLFHQPYIDSALFQAQNFQPSSYTANISDGSQAETVFDDASGGDVSSGLSTQLSASISGDNTYNESRRRDHPRRIVQPLGGS